jgi:hypothetical protein
MRNAAAGVHAVSTAPPYRADIAPRSGIVKPLCSFRRPVSSYRFMSNRSFWAWSEEGLGAGQTQSDDCSERSKCIRLREVSSLGTIPLQLVPRRQEGEQGQGTGLPCHILTRLLP